MYIERVPNRNSPPAVLLRESYREGNKVRKRTLANLSKLPDDVIENLRIVLKGGVAVENYGEAFQIKRSLPHGHISGVLGTLNKLGVPELIDGKASKNRAVIIAMIVARIIDPCSKLATARGLNQETCGSSLSHLLGLESTDEDDLYEALDWLIARQTRIENELAKKHLKEGALVLYDVSSTYFVRVASASPKGKTCPLASYGYSRDKKSGATPVGFPDLGNAHQERGKQQIVFGLLCNREGCPIAVEVFEGNTSDTTTMALQIEKVRHRFGLSRIIWVGDRGMITQTRINQEFSTREDLDWITALTAAQIKLLAEQEVIQLGLFDEQNLVEVESVDYPGERLIACRNPITAESRAQKREKLLQKTEEELEKIVQATLREKRALKGADQIGLRVGKVINKYRVGKFFELEITNNSFSYTRKPQGLKAAAALDGLYVIRTSVDTEVLDAPATVKAYKSLSQVEQAFRSYKTMDLKVRPIYHHLESRVKSHVFLCMLAYYVEWHMKQALAPILFDDEEGTPIDWDGVTPVKRSKKALSKARKKRTAQNLPVHSFSTLMADLGTITLNTIASKLEGADLTFLKITQPTPVQQKALDLLGVSLFVPSK
ncbi:MULTISPECIES: IS1634 family transposase [Moorena]|uniref:Transposase, IS4 family n=1 Tax=Moorena producens 3L TaxID=489825 RepID=F4Y161_9CYAN|nr:MULTISPECIES: IS1634 family transposase [Moorena]EGJ29572.1 transposase, IS4 family [Moorena producens 3L]NEP32355.1 IS1634 family transposase [Moorena sp. SIO3B2]NEP67185.1 IS1634 family transposase [Moorena sp. SIO3A5]NEQ07515.1 IS1634 family transposase [Moorena sp. SIO4E2]NER89404.1 IS1634 family transposase [Moorena sp. SIO3A2]